jgi:DNA-binding Lrp family transcriptional regulator
MSRIQRKNSIDTIDQRILSALQKDGRLTYVQLADKVGLSESACLRRVRLLEKNGIIDQYVMLIDQMSIGKPGNVFVRVTLEGQQQEKLQHFEREIIQVKEVMECYLMSGDSDFLLRIIISDNDDYMRIHNRLTSIPGVLRVQSSFALKTVLKKTELPLD